MGSDADALNQIQNREKMIGRGMDMGTMPYSPDVDYDKKPTSNYKSRKEYGPMGEIRPLAEEYGFEWLSKKDTHKGTASMGGVEYGPKFIWETDGRGTFSAKLVIRKKLKKRPYVEVDRSGPSFEGMMTEEEFRNAFEEVTKYVGSLK